MELLTKTEYNLYKIMWKWAKINMSVRQIPVSSFIQSHLQENLRPQAVSRLLTSKKKMYEEMGFTFSTRYCRICRSNVLFIGYKSREVCNIACDRKKKEKYDKIHKMLEQIPYDSRITTDGELARRIRSVAKETNILVNARDIVAMIRRNPDEFRELKFTSVGWMKQEIEKCQENKNL